MKDAGFQIPLYIKVPLIIIGLFAVFAILYLGQNVILPLVFATIIAIVLHPVVNWLIRIKINRLIAIILVLSLTIVVAYSLIQFIDNNYIVPKIVASKVKINALFSIIVVIAGNALWGIPGMFLSIPILAIVKLVFDHIDSLKPWGFLLGDTMPSQLKIPPILKKLISK